LGFVLLLSLVQETYGSDKLYELIIKSLDAMKRTVEELTAVLKCCGVLGRSGWASTPASTLMPS